MLDVPPVRLEVRDTGQHIHAVRKEQSFPPAATRWTPLYFNAGTGQLVEELPATVQTTAFDLEKGAAVFEWSVPRDLELRAYPNRPA